MNCFTRELLKASYGKHVNYQVKLIIHFHFLHKYAYLLVIEHQTNKVAIYVRFRYLLPMVMMK